MAMNQTRMIGPSMRPSLPVPRLWIANKPIRIRRLIGRISGSSAGSSTRKPSTAASTVIAGVSSASPKNSDNPSTAAPEIRLLSQRGRSGDRCASAASASDPPSPRLWARRTKQIYLIVTTMISDQKISEIAPITATGMGMAPPVANTDCRTA